LLFPVVYQCRISLGHFLSLCAFENFTFTTRIIIKFTVVRGHANIHERMFLNNSCVLDVSPKSLTTCRQSDGCTLCLFNIQKVIKLKKINYAKTQVWLFFYPQAQQ